MLLPYMYSWNVLFFVDNFRLMLTTTVYLNEYQVMLVKWYSRFFYYEFSHKSFDDVME